MGLPENALLDAAYFDSNVGFVASESFNLPCQLSQAEGKSWGRTLQANQAWPPMLALQMVNTDVSFAPFVCVSWSWV